MTRFEITIQSFYSCQAHKCLPGSWYHCNIKLRVHTQELTAMEEFGITTHMSKLVSGFPSPDPLDEKLSEDIISLNQAETYVIRPELVKICKDAIAEKLTEKASCSAGYLKLNFTYR